MTIPLKHRTDGLGEFEPDDVVPIEHGGTGATTAEQARQNLGISGGGGDSWNWVSINEIGTLVNADNNLVYAEEYFIDGVGGIQFCIKDNILWVKALFRMKISISGTGWQIFTITDPNYFPKLGPRNSTVIRPAGHQLDIGNILNQFVYYVDKIDSGFMIHSAQSLNAPGIYSILPTAIGFI
ncbi:hypothetical protein I9189_015790 [Acinetobacter bereziniae]|uniref:hypothetical protein n=1 Tax=Acinetobacter bereziniae TaxID=106648 RepID=UPI001D0F2DFB|nr:hypothetical protein [Acinetobacter bereziniae]UUN92524.1 hypothetical protein I9189_015790 [Acinetobacter bereziniae]